MPRDDWAKARSRDAARNGIPTSTKRSKGKQGNSTNRKGGMSGAAKAASVQRLSSPEATLWFGKYKGRRIADIPRDYLLWLADSEPPSNHWRMNALRRFLKRYLKN